jgi:molybdopterin-guanine dinucleotide biosynthesis protein A
MTQSCSAIILAGGESRRMGRPKAWLEFHGRPLLAHMVDLLAPRFDDIVVVAAPGQELPETSARVLRDEAPGRGPVAGLAVGLREVMHPLAFVTAVDAPLLQLGIVDLLLRETRGADAAVPEWEGMVHPLCAVYRRSKVLSVFEEQLRRGKLRVKDVLLLVKPRILSAPVVRAVDPEGLSFITMNFPDEYETVLEASILRRNR